MAHARTRSTAALAVGLLVGVVVPSSAQDGPADVPPSEVSPEAPPAEVAALAGARTQVDVLAARSRAAEGARARAEGVWVDAVRRSLAAGEAFAVAVQRLDAARAVLRDAVSARDAQQALFNDQVANSYKYTGGGQAAILMLALQSAESAHDAARLIHEVDSIMGHNYDRLGAREADVAAAQWQVEVLREVRALAFAELEAAQAALDPAMAEATRARGVAAARERGLLGALEAALAAEEAALAVEVDLAALDPLPEDPLAPGTATLAEDAGAALGQRREWLANRRSALAAEQALPSPAWAPLTDLQCPVLGAEFDNDFHFPRSHGRRHLGLDLMAPHGTPVRVMADGVVTAIDTTDAFDGDGDLGGITVSYENTYGRFYNAHLASVADGLEVGDEVRAGDTVGYVGTSGNARGGAPHLHLGIYREGVAVNPWVTVAIVCAEAPTLVLE